MSGDRVFATAKPEEVFVFRHNFSDNKWENVANKKDGSATVTFRKRGSNFFMRIVGDGGLREEHQLSQTTHVKDSGQGFIQVPLPEKRQLIGIKFKRAEMAAIFLGKIREQMNVAGPVTMQAVVIDDKPASDVPNPEKLPPAIGYGGGPTTLQPATRTPAPPPAQNTVVEATDTHPGPHPPADYPPKQQTQPVPYQHQKIPPRPSLSNPEGSNPQQQLHHPGPVGYNPGHQPYPSPNIQPSQPAAFPGPQQQFHPAVSSTPYNPAPPIERQPQPQMMERQPPVMDRQHQLPMMNRQPQLPMMDRQAQPPMMDRQPQQAMIERQAPVKASRAMVEAMAPPPIPKKPPPKPEPEIPSFSSEEPSDHAMFLANAINAGNFEAAHRMIHMLEKMVRESKKPQKKLAISYSNTSNGPSPDDTDVKLHLFIEFQSQYKSSLEFYLDFKSSLRISDIQQHLELSHHIPRATQNWIIGESLVKGDLLNKTLRDFDIDGDGTATSPIKVFIYVMHSKKAHVPKEEYEAIRQCQQEEWERKNQGRKLPWQEPLTLPTTAPPTVPPRSQPLPHQPEYPTPQPEYPTQQMRRLEPAGGGFMGGQPVGQDFPMPQPRNVPPTVRQAWASPPHEDDTYARFNRNIPTPAMAPPPQRVQPDFDPTYAKLQNYQPHPAETRPRPLQAPPPNIGYSRPPFEGGEGRYVPVPRPHQPVHRHMVAVYPPEARGPPETRGPPDIRGPPVQYPAPQPEPVVPRPPPPAARQVGWSCPKCTFINKPRRPGCEICSADRPADYQIPEDIPMDADEARIVAGLQGSEQLFYQYEEAEKQKRERERAENFRALLQAEEEALIKNDEQFDCPICFDTVAAGEGVVLRNCLHQFCKECLKETIMKSPEAEVKCPFMDDKYQCNVPLPEREIKQLVTEEELQGLYKRGLRQAESAAANSYHCKTTDCEGFCFYEDEVNHFHCPLCKKVNCLTCKAIHEGVNCQEYQDDLKRRAANDEAAKATQEMLQQMVEAGDAMHCPSCKIVVQKKDGCDWIRCSVCKTEICWATKQARWGPKGKGDKSGGCHCKENGKKCHPLCRNCH